MWSRFARDLKDDVSLRWGGEMRWSATEPEAEKLLAHAEELRSWGYPVIEVTKDQARTMEPGVVMHPFTAAVYCGIEGHVDTQKAVRVCLNRVQQAGGELISNDAVASMDIRSGPDQTSVIQSVSLASGRELPCDVLVLTAGYETTGLAAKAGIELPQRRSPGVTVVTEPLSPIFKNIVCMHTPNDLPGPLINVRQFADGSVMVHGGTQDGSMGDARDDEAKMLVAEIARFIPSLTDAKVKEVRRGMRPMPEDGFPVIGFAGAVPNLYMAVMHSGVTLAALTGEFAATEILDAARVDILEPYRLERFG